MAISIIYTGQPMVGTANDDFFIAYQLTTGTSNNTINGDDGDDLVIGDSSNTLIPSGANTNGSIDEALNLEMQSIWSTAENPMFGDWSKPHGTAIVEATIGESEYFSVVVGAGQQIIVDIDFGTGDIGVPGDLFVELQDFLGNVLATSDDSLVTDGGLGSFAASPGGATSRDPYLEFTVATAGTYYINVRPFNSSTFTANNTFLLNLSVSNHSVAATNPVQGADAINGGDGNDTLFGQGGNDVINGNGGNDLIHAGSGADIVHGGTGKDTIHGGENSEENVHGDDGNDILISGGEGHYYGDAGNDIIYAGPTTGINEVLDGGEGIDTLDTRTWNGTYNVNLATGLTDFGEIFINFERLIAGNGADTITGTSEVNIIRANGGADVVRAGGGNDTIEGGADGDDLNGQGGTDTLDYTSSNAGVSVSLQANTASGGHATGDTIANFENVTGSAHHDVLVGNAAANIINGKGGADEMRGRGGDDRYYVNNAGDVVIEASGAGNDRVISTVSFSLAGQHIERLTLDGTAAINGTGNSLANTIVGNAAANVIDGKTGADHMQGRGGNDRYYVNTTGDVVIEASEGGNDRVISTVSFSLAGQHIERLTLDGTGSINGAGNSLTNVITGNSASNVLNGKTGNDTLTGGGAADFFRFNTAPNAVTNVDTITDFKVNLDKIQLDDAIFAQVGTSLSASEFVANKSGAATSSAHNILYDTTDGRLFYDPDGTGAGARIHFATLKAGLALDHLDFVVI